mgnify:CR=1 FL=1
MALEIIEIVEDDQSQAKLLSAKDSMKEVLIVLHLNPLEAFL